MRNLIPIAVSILAIAIMVLLLLPLELIWSEFAPVFVLAAVLGVFVRSRGWLWGAALGLAECFLLFAVGMMQGTHGGPIMDSRDALLLMSGIVFSSATAEIFYRLRLMNDAGR